MIPQARARRAHLPSSPPGKFDARPGATPPIGGHRGSEAGRVGRHRDAQGTADRDGSAGLDCGAAAVPRAPARRCRSLGGAARAARGAAGRERAGRADGRRGRAGQGAQPSATATRSSRASPRTRRPRAGWPVRPSEQRRTSATARESVPPSAGVSDPRAHGPSRRRDRPACRDREPAGPGRGAVERRPAPRLARLVLGQEHVPADPRRAPERRGPGTPSRVHQVRVDEVQRTPRRVGRAQRLARQPQRLQEHPSGVGRAGAHDLRDVVALGVRTTFWSTADWATGWNWATWATTAQASSGKRGSAARSRTTRITAAMPVGPSTAASVKATSPRQRTSRPEGSPARAVAAMARKAAASAAKSQRSSRHLPPPVPTDA